MIYEYNIIKESKLSLLLLKTSKDELKTAKQYKDFAGDTHQDFREYGQGEHIKLGLNSTFGYTRTKNGVPYWVLPYPKNTILDVERKDENGLTISKTYTLEQLNNFGFDIIEDETI